jgi:hypothetical protein
MSAVFMGAHHSDGENASQWEKHRRWMITAAVPKGRKPRLFLAISAPSDLIAS